MVAMEVGVQMAMERYGGRDDGGAVAGREGGVLLLEEEEIELVMGEISGGRGVAGGAHAATWGAGWKLGFRA